MIAKNITDKILVLVAVASLLPVSLLQASEENEDLIYQPVIKTSSLAQDEVEEQYFRYTFRLGQLMPQNAEFKPHVSGGVDFILPQGWYAGAELNYATWDSQVLANDKLTEKFNDTLILSLAAGYELLQGSAYIVEGMTLPWQLSVQLNVGNQLLGGDQARYVALSSAWKVNYDKFFAGVEWRGFTTNHSYLRKYSMNEGREWSVLFGAYF